MILPLPRLLLPTAAVSIFFVAAPALLSQVSASPLPFSLPSASLLPDAPTPQSTVAALDMESAFSSSAPTREDVQQTQVPPSDATQQPKTEAEKKQESEEEAQRELHQRMGGVVPNFNAVLDGSSVRLTPGQKMRAAFKSATDPYQFGLAAFTSGFGQAENSHTTYQAIPGTDPAQYTQLGYGQGWAGYGKRMGASFTDQFDGNYPRKRRFSHSAPSGLALLSHGDWLL